MTSLLRTGPLHRSSFAENAGGAKSLLIAEAEWVALAEGLPVDLSGATKRLSHQKPQAIKIIRLTKFMTAGMDLHDIHDVFCHLPSVRGWPIPHTDKDHIVPESFTSRRISFGRPSCCDKNVADDFLVSYHNSVFVTSGTSGWLNQTPGCWNTRLGCDKDQKTPIRPDTSRIQNRRYLPSNISPNRIIRL